MPNRRDVREVNPKRAHDCVNLLKELVKNQYLSFTLDEYSKGENALFWYNYKL